MDYFTQSARETKELGREIGAGLDSGETLALFGDLGGGKTTFLQGVALGLGVKDRILSPTFIISREYPLKKGGKFYHFDWYRLDNEKQARLLGIKELFGGKNIVAIEWADRAKSLLPKRRVEIYFKYQGENKRQITIIRDE
jgi:tRNA threonylcarbamoyladenosine biosynthesis protein TsaE